MFHRGPDEEGFYFSPQKNFGMGIRRLKIIDLATGSQPIFNETKDVAVLLNGEIYNYLELREELEKKGHRFITNSDTETVAHGYEEYGLGFLQKLNGMFGIALWDEAKKILLLARDRMGIKPLYWRKDHQSLAFASELKSLLIDPDCSKEMDLVALDDYFSLLYVPGPRTIFQAIQKIPPAHFLLCDAQKKSIKIYPYWERPLIAKPKDLGWEHYKEKLDWLFADAVRLQLRSDVPNGVFLSSGLDSSTIAFYASRVAGQKIKTFTVHFPEESYSEQQGAKRVAEQIASEHHEILLKPNVEELILKTSEFFDEPFADSSAIPTYLLCQFARQKITVALSGEGGDELFAGYPTYLATKFACLYRKIPPPLRQMFARMVQTLPVSWERIPLDYKLKQFVYGAEESPQRAHFAWKEIFSEGEKKLLYTDEFLREKNGHEGFESFEKLFEKVGNGTELEKLLFVDQNTYLLDEFLVKSDRMSMAHSLEVRVPILDHRLVELAAEIPAKYKLRRFTTKWTLRKLMEGKLPKEIISGAKKGFSPPIPHWIAGELKPFVRELLAEKEIAKTGLLQPGYVKQILDEHFAKKRDNHRRIWALLNFVLWRQNWGT